jgi:hypothetical protein
MTYEILVDGVPIRCDSAAAAIALAREAAGLGATVVHSGNGRPDVPPVAHGATNGASLGSRWTEQRIREFFKVIKAQQQKLIDALLESPDGRTSDQLCQILGLKDGMALAGVFTGLFKNAKRVGADPKDLYLRRSATIADARQYEYTLTEGFRLAAKKWRN